MLLSMSMTNQALVNHDSIMEYAQSFFIVKAMCGSNWTVWK